MQILVALSNLIYDHRVKTVCQVEIIEYIHADHLHTSLSSQSNDRTHIVETFYS